MFKYSMTRTSLRKHDVIKVCSIEYVTTHTTRISVANLQGLDRSQNYRKFNVRTMVYPLKDLSQYNSLLF